MNQKIINDEKINALALTVMNEAGVILLPSIGNDAGTYKDWVNSGWDFYFIIKDEIVYAIMEADFPHGKQHYEKPANKYISTIIQNF